MQKRRPFLPFVLIYFAALTAIIAVNANIRLNDLRALGFSLERQIAADGAIFDMRYGENDTLLLRKISPGGELLGHMALPTRAADGSPVSYHILAANGHKAYLHTYARPHGSSGRSGTRILVCDMLTRKSFALYQPQDQMEMRLVGSRAETAPGGGLYFGFEYQDALSAGRLKVSRIDKESGDVSELMDVPLPFMLTCFTVTEQGVLFAASPDSSVYRYADGGWNLIFKPTNGSAAQLLQGGNGALYLFMTGYGGAETNRLLRLAPGTSVFVDTRLDIADYINLSVYDDDTLMALTGDFAYEIRHGGEAYEFSSLTVPFPMLWDSKALCYMLAEALLALLLVGMIRHLRLKRKTGLIIKLLAVSVPLFTLGCLLLIIIPSQDMRHAVEETVPMSLLSDTAKIAENIDGDRFAAINWKNPWADAYYLELRNRLEGLAGAQSLQWWGPPSNLIMEDTIKNNQRNQPGEQESKLYTSYRIYRADGDKVFSAICENAFVNVEIAYSNPIPGSGDIGRLLDSLLPVFTRLHDGEFWLALLYPLTDAQGNLAGILEVSRQTGPAKQAADSVTLYIVIFSIGVFTVMLLVYILVVSASLRGLNSLKRGALAFSGGDYSIRVPVGSNDEIGDIAAVFNGMADSVERNMESIKTVGAAYSRFVPDEILSILRLDSITDINTTDYASLRAMFLLLTTESFDSYRDEAYLDAVNDFYTCILPVLSRGGGLVERFTANELRALFDCEPLAALNTALKMFSALNRLNKEFENSGQKPIECSVFLGFAESFLGVAGYGKRLNIILQSHYSYETESIRMIGLRYGCRLLLEQNAFDGLGAEASRYRHRLLGYIMDGGEQRALYDFYDGEPVERVCFKDATRERFNEAVELYYAARYDKARSMFINIIQQTPDDLAAREYLKKSHLRFGSDTPPDNLFDV